MFSFWWKDALASYDSIELSDLWPATTLMCLASTLLSDNRHGYCRSSHTVVGEMWSNSSCLTHGFHHIGEFGFTDWWITIPHGSFSGLNFPDSSLGRWNRQSNLGLRCLMKFSFFFLWYPLATVRSVYVFWQDLILTTKIISNDKKLGQYLFKLFHWIITIKIEMTKEIYITNDDCRT